MKRTYALSTLCLLLGLLMQPPTASASFQIFTYCEGNIDVVPVPGYPNPNVYCEMYWDVVTGTFRGNNGRWEGIYTYEADPSINSKWDTGKFDMRHTEQPLMNWVVCDDLTGPVAAISRGYQYESERGGGFSLVDFVTDGASYQMFNSHPCPH